MVDGSGTGTNPGGQGWRFERLGLGDGGHLRLGFRAAPAHPRGTALLLTGRCECLEKYDEQAEDWTRRGWRTVAMDWRGQGGSSRFLDDRQRGHAPDFDTLLNDLETALPRLLPAEARHPIVAFGHSMGGHLLLRFALERRHPFAGLILSAPMFGICTPLPEPLIHHVARQMVASGHGDDYALGQSSWPTEPGRFENNPFTSDPDRFRLLHDIYTADPELSLGGVTWGWLDSAYRSMAALMGDRRLKALRLPVLLLSAGKDRVVPPGRHRRMATRLGNGSLRVYASARHELMMERDDIRGQVWDDIDHWLSKLPTAPAAG